MREFRVTVKDEVKSNTLLCRVVPAVINVGGIAREHNATRIIFILPESWEADEGSFFVECESNNGETALSDELFVTEGNGEKQIYFDIPLGATAAGTSEFTLKHNFYAEDNKTLVKSVRSAKLRIRFSDSTQVDEISRKIAEDLLGGMTAQINDLLKRFYNGEFNGKDGLDGEKGEKGDRGDTGTGLEQLRALLHEAKYGNISTYSERNNLIPEDSGGMLYLPWEEIFANFPDEDLDAYSRVLHNGFYNFNINHSFYHDELNEVLVVFVDEYNNDENIRNTNIVFTNGEFNTADSYIEELIDGEMVMSPLAEPPMYFKLPQIDSFETDYASDDITLFYSPPRFIEALADAILKSHTHLNAKTLGELSCYSVEAGAAEGPVILPDTVGLDRLKFWNSYIRYCSDGAVIMHTQEVEKSSAKYLRLWLSRDEFYLSGSSPLPDYIDIPVFETKNVTENSTPDITFNGIEVVLPGSSSDDTATSTPTLSATDDGEGNVTLTIT